MTLKNYIKQNRTVFAAAGIFSLLCFCYMLVTPGISIDEETWIQIEEPFAKWIVQGRFGIDVLNFLLLNEWRYAPVLWDLLAIAAWNFGGIIFGYSLFGKDGKKLLLFFFQAYLCSLPFVLGEMFSFSMFSFQVALGMLGTAVAFLLSVQAAEKEQKKKSEWIIVVILLMFSFSVYQAYICVYVTAVVAYSLKGFLEQKKNLLRIILTCALACVAGTILYYGINIILMKLFATSSYLTDNYVGWFDEGGPLKAGFMALANIARVSLAIPVAGEIVYGGEVIRVVTIAFVIFALWRMSKEKGVMRRIGVCALSVALVAAPFILFLVLGTYKTHGRVLLGLSLAGAAEIYFIGSYLKRQVLRQLASVAVMYLLFLNAKNMNVLYYSANVAYEHDRTVANQVMYDIKRLGYDYHQKPIVFLGMAEMDDVGLPVSDSVGSAVFAWDDGNIPRMANFLKTEGYRVLTPDAVQIQNALKQKDEMGVWPMEGSIRQTKESIVVYFSEPTDKWYQINQAVKE